MPDISAPDELPKAPPARPRRNNTPGKCHSLSCLSYRWGAEVQVQISTKFNY